jgi:hypothetical protein
MGNGGLTVTVSVTDTAQCPSGTGGAVSTKLLLFQAPGYGASSLSPHYGGGQRGGVMGGSPQAAASPHHTASPQVPSPQGQTLDLSVSRVPAR